MERRVEIVAVTLVFGVIAAFAAALAWGARLGGKLLDYTLRRNDAKTGNYRSDGRH